MRRNPRPHQRFLALARVDVYVSIGAFVLAVDDVFDREYVVLIERFVPPKAVGVDGERLLLMPRQ